MASELDDMLKALRALGDTKALEQAVAKRAGPALLAAVEKTLAAGESPEGKPWEDRKKGGRAYANAAKRIDGAVYGNLVRLTLTGPEVYGHFGARGMPVRQMLPDAGASIPKSVERALLDAASIVFDEATK